MTSHLTESDMDELFPDLNAEEREHMKEAISTFSEFFFECIKKKIKYNELHDFE